MIQKNPTAIHNMLPSFRPLNSLRRLQRGYMIEIPLLVVAALIIFSILLPALPPLGQKVLVALVAAIVVFGLYYMIVVPGWMPGDKSRLRPPWNWLVFGVAAILVGTITVAILFGMHD